MGYYTRFELDLPNSPELLYEVIDAIEEISGYNGHLEGDNDVKWYDYDKDMRRVSKMYPSILMVLSGTGEEHGDQWKAYYVDGKCHKCSAVVTFPEFDPNQLT